MGSKSPTVQLCTVNAASSGLALEEFSTTEVTDVQADAPRRDRSSQEDIERTRIMLKNVSRGRRMVALFTVTGALFAVNAQSQDRTRYRDYRLGSTLASVAALTKVSASEAKTLHQRPTLIQELDWRQPYVMSGSTMSQSDPVQRIVFSFCGDQLFRLVISYDRHRTDGLTDGDMIEAISQMYGVALLQASSTSVSGLPTSLAAEFGAPIALWGDADYAVALYRSSFVSEFRVVVTSPQLDAL